MLRKNNHTASSRKLTASEQKRLDSILKQIHGDGKVRTTQQSIPYLAMSPDGICQLTTETYSKSIRFEDVNYELLHTDEKSALFENWCDVINYFDSSVAVQFTYLNRKKRNIHEESVFQFPQKNDEFHSVKEEYVGMLRNQYVHAGNGMEKERYITFTVTAENSRNAKARLERIAADIRNNLSNIGVRAEDMTGYDRLQTLYEMLHPNGEEFEFAWDWLPSTGIHTKDVIAPSSFNFSSGRIFGMGDKIGAVSFLQILAPDMSDQMLREFLNMENEQIINIHIRSIEQTEAVKYLKRKITDLDKMKIDEQKKAIRNGYDMDILPTDLATYGEDAKNLLQDLQNRNERMFMVTVLFANIADTRQKLENQIFTLSGLAQQYNCSVVRLDYQQEDGFMSSLPLGINKIDIERGLTTSSTAIFIPFVTNELFQSGESLYYGLNTLSHNMIMCDRKKLKNPNGIILGTPGSGKSFAAKREISNVFFATDDDIIVCDPESEYYPLVERLHGQVIQISPVSSQYVNPMDIRLNSDEEENPLALKSDFILSMCELIIGDKDGLKPVEKTIIDRAARNVYQHFFTELRGEPSKMPILSDLYEEILRQPEPEAKQIASSLELYVSGSLNVFNHRTNVELNNRLICFDIKQLGKQLKKLGMLIIQEQVWNKVSGNRAVNKSTRYYIDEMHLLLKEEQTAAYTVEIWKRFRKWGGIPTGITQNTKDFFKSREIENILENSDFILMLNQAVGDRELLARQLNISPAQLDYVTQSDMGEGLLFYGNIILPFADHFPQNTELYSIMTTRPDDRTVSQEMIP